MSADQRIAIVGFGGVFPGADDLEEYWAKIRAGLSSIDEVPAERWPLSFEEIYAPDPAEDRVYSRRAGFISPDFDFDLEGLQVDGHLISRLDPLFRVLLHAGREAWKSAALKAPDRERCGIVVGNIVLPTVGSAALTEEILGPLFEAAVLGTEAPAMENRTERLDRCVAGLPAGMLAHALGLHGGAFTVDAACSSSLYALKLAGDELIEGRADIMISGADGDGADEDGQCQCACRQPMAVAMRLGKMAGVGQRRGGEQEKKQRDCTLARAALDRSTLQSEEVVREVHPASIRQNPSGHRHLHARPG